MHKNSIILVLKLQGESVRTIHRTKFPQPLPRREAD